MIVIRQLFSIQSQTRSCLIVVSLIFMMSACQTSPKTTQPELSGHGYHQKKQRHATQSQTLKMLYQQHSNWRGTPYRLGGETRAGIDCSAFVQLTFNDLFGIKLPRTTGQQIRSGRRIGRSDLQTGDLVFFRDGRHVGIYLENDRFLHASTRLGVTISRMNNVYWSRYYWRAIRIRP